MEAMIETTVLTKLRGMPDFQKRQVLDFVEFLEAKAPEFASEQVDQRQEPVATANLLYVNPERAAMQREQAAFQMMLPELLISYKNQYVAFYNGQVVDSDSDITTLVKRLDQSHPGVVALIKQVTDQPERVIHMRSPLVF